MIDGSPQALLDALPDAVLAVDVKSQAIVAANRTCERLFERSLNELLGANFVAQFVLDEQPRVRSALDSLGKSERAYIAQVQVLGSKSTAALMEIHSQKAAGDSDRVLVIVRDTTVQRRTEGNLARIEKLEALGILAGGIAHDFNNLVAGALGQVEMAREFMLEDKVDNAVECLSEAAGTFNRARELTRQLLTFSKGGAPQKKLGHLGPLVRSVLGYALAGANLELDFKELEASLPIAFDETQIAQVIDNLVCNARYAMPQGGKLEVSINTVNINVGTTLPLSVGTYACITVRDTGIGIPLEHMPRLFDPFFSTRPGGTGLGLASSFSIVKRHGGHLDVESELGKGTACHIYLPHDPQALTEPKNSTSSRPTRQGRILVMDDENSVRRVTCSFLKRMGYEVVPAADGGEAIEIYRRTLASGNRFAFVILDLTVPGGLGGRETLEALQEIDPHVAAIATSGYSNDPIMSNPEAYGFRAGLSKPYSRQEFIGLIARVTG